MTSPRTVKIRQKIKSAARPSISKMVWNENVSQEALVLNRRGTSLNPLLKV